MKHDIQRRYAFIETCIYWGMGLTATHLGRIFGIARQNAQKNIKDYKAIYPGQMKYNASSKHHEASESFKPHLIRDQPDTYLDYLRGNHLVSRFWSENDWSELSVYDVDGKTRPYLDSQCVRVVISALQQKKVVRIQYHSKNLTQYLTVSPNNLVYAAQRYHIRAYCHESFYYIDLGLSRILAAEFTTDDWVSEEEDNDWNTPVNLKFTPNLNLPIQVLNTLKQDYQITDGHYLVRTNLALAYYIQLNLLSKADSEGNPLWLLDN